MIPAKDHELAQQARRGNQEAFGEIIRRYQTTVYNTAYRMLGNYHEAEDATQEAFIRAFRFMGTFDPDRPPGPWLRRITVNICLNYLESIHPETRLEEELPQPTQPSSHPEEQLITRELGQRIHTELLRLPARLRAVIELRHFQDLSYAEIASTLHRPPSEIKSDLFRARKLLAKCLNDIHHEPSR